VPVAGSGRPPLSPKERRILRIALSVVCATLRLRAAGFTTPKLWAEETLNSCRSLPTMG
jgi:hypothetical protein